jgi:hypothetical protein
MKLNNKQIEFCRLIAEESYKASTAYRVVYGSTMSVNVSNASAYKLLQKEEVKRYLATIQSEISDKYKVTKESQIIDLQKQKHRFEQLQELADKEELTDNENSKFRRLSTLLKGSDYNRTCDMLNKMIGSYEPEQIEIKQEWNFKFTQDDDDDDDTDN